MYEIRITGFKTKEQANAFRSWYEGQGEQYACYWFEERLSEGEIDVDSMPTDMSKYRECKWIDNIIELPLKIEATTEE